MSKYIDVNNENFDEVTKTGLVMVDFWAPWCGPCRQIAPILDTLAEKYDGQVTIAKINVDENSELSTKYSVRSIPTILYMKDGEVVDEQIGGSTIGQFSETLDGLLNS